VCKPDVSKSVVTAKSVITAVRFTVGDHIIIKCSRLNKKYEANHFLKMFPDREFQWDKHLTEKVTAVVSLTRVRFVVDYTMPTLLQISTKLNISHWYFDQCRCPTKTSSSVKIILSKRFPTWFFHSHPFNEMFIVNGKSYCCNEHFFWLQVYIAASKEHLRTT